MNNKKYWIKKTNQEIRNRIFTALDENIDFRSSDIMGVPASHLDGNVFYDDHPFLAQAPYLSSLVKNPNHIGCHTMGDSEEFFKGTQAIERETIELLATDLFNAKDNSVDGYIASGGTEANIQACWIYRNKLLAEGFSEDEIAIVCSEDTHYSLPKAANLLRLNIFQLPVTENNRSIDAIGLKDILYDKNIKAVILVLNMGTTMFGSVDNAAIIDDIKELDIKSYVHIDGAYGGFIYSVANPDNELSFADSRISSITIDAHKMLQAPYGTGIFLCRKNLMQYTMTKEAGYVHGLDITLSGSRSGANAIAVWMILMTYGYYGWKELIETLNRRTDYLCEQLVKKNIGFFREPYLNIVTLQSSDINREVCLKYGLVPEQHSQNNKFWKIVVMQHVDMNVINRFLSEIK